MLPFQLSYIFQRQTHRPAFSKSLAWKTSQSKRIAKFGIAYTMLSRKNESDGNRKNDFP